MDYGFNIKNHRDSMPASTWLSHSFIRTSKTSVAVKIPEPSPASKIDRFSLCGSENMEALIVLGTKKVFSVPHNSCVSGKHIAKKEI